jgi:hypothetical protein
MLKYIIPAAVLAFFMAFTSAWAMPAASSRTMMEAPAPQIVQVQAQRNVIRRPGVRPGRPAVRPGRPAVRPGFRPGRPVVRPGRPGFRPGYGRPHRYRYAPGARLGAAPYGYRRYGARPYDWRTRGCIVVGPIWFCP